MDIGYQEKLIEFLAFQPKYRIAGRPENIRQVLELTLSPSSFIPFGS
jgi:hypothetical protein